jgi:F420-non-reducing hydrogenase iron-sulfur subunit
MTKKLLECIGIDPNRVRLEWISASEGPQFAQVVRDFVEQIKGLGPMPLPGPGFAVGPSFLEQRLEGKTKHR